MDYRRKPLGPGLPDAWTFHYRHQFYAWIAGRGNTGGPPPAWPLAVHTGWTAVRTATGMPARPPNLRQDRAGGLAGPVIGLNATAWAEPPLPPQTTISAAHGLLKRRMRWLEPPNHVARVIPRQRQTLPLLYNRWTSSGLYHLPFCRCYRFPPCMAAGR